MFHNSIAPPPEFSFRGQEWASWSRRFQRYRECSGLGEQSDAKQINTLIYLMGDRAEDLLFSFNLKTADAKQYKTVFEKFDSHFSGNKNIIYERAKFNRRSQRPGEPVEEFITDLLSLAKSCEFGILKDELIRDKIVVGICNDQLSETLQLDKGLTLERAMERVRQAEQVHQQQAVVRGETSEEVSKVSQWRGVGKNKSDKCTNCLKYHPQRPCPARRSTCRNCGKVGHWQAACRGRKDVGAAAIAAPCDSFESESFLGTINRMKEQKDGPWRTNVSILGKEINFKIDTGADVTVIDENILRVLRKKIAFLPAKKNLFGPGASPIRVLGKFRATLRWRGRSCEDEVYVIKGSQEGLLGRPALTNLGILSWLNSISCTGPERKFDKIFNGLRTNPVEPLMPTEPTVRPWQQVGADLMTWGNMSYLIVVDYYSSYPEVVTLMGTTSAAITCHLKGIFARHGIPETMRTDNGPQFQGEDFRKFCRTWGIKHVTSSPGFPQSNGKVESAVKIIKNIIKKEKDLWLGILAYRASPLQGEKSPSELLMGRRLRTTIPTSTEQLLPQWSQNINESRRRWNRRTSMKRWFDNRHKARELPELAIGSRVFIKDLKRYGTVREKLLEPRSYRVNISSGVVRRNRAQLILVPKEGEGKQDERRNPLYSFRTEPDAGGETHTTPEIDHQPVKTRFGRVSRPTRRFSPC